MAVEIIPSVLAADFGRLREEVQAAAAAGAARVQIDVMDGHFVPNISVGVPLVRALADMEVVLDVHLMIERPERYLEAFAAAGAGVLTVHAEATPHLHRAVNRVRELGVAVGAALNPATPLVVLEDVLPELDVVLVMTVDPGFGGQTFIPAMLPKIKRLRSLIDRRRCRADIQVDGGINLTTARAVVEAGATQLVAGTAVYAAGMPVAEAIRRLQAAAEGNAPAAEGRRGGQ